MCIPEQYIIVSNAQVYAVEYNTINFLPKLKSSKSCSLTCHTILLLSLCLPKFPIMLEGKLTAAMIRQMPISNYIFQYITSFKTLFWIQEWQIDLTASNPMTGRSQSKAPVILALILNVQSIFLQTVHD